MSITTEYFQILILKSNKILKKSDILFIAGGVSLICPVPFESKFIVDMFVAIGSGCLLWLLTVYRHELNRIGGLLMLLSYVVYLIYLC